MSATFIDSPALASAPADRSAAARWFGRVATALVLLFAIMDFGMKLALAKPSVDGTIQMGYQLHHIQLIGVLALVCTIVFVIPRTAVLGAVLWTGYLGGAVASNIRIDAPLFSHTLFPVYFAVLLWAGLYVRDARVAAMLGPGGPAR